MVARLRSGVSGLNSRRGQGTFFFSENTQTICETHTTLPSVVTKYHSPVGIAVLHQGGRPPPPSAKNKQERTVTSSSPTILYVTHGYSDSLLAGRSGDQIPLEKDFLHQFKPALGAT